MNTEFDFRTATEEEQLAAARLALRGRHLATISRLQLAMHIGYMDALKVMEKLEAEGFVEKRKDPKTGIESLFVVQEEDSETVKSDGT